MTRQPLSGTFTALVTPFTADGIDREAYRRLVEAQFAAGVTGVVPVGTTGESPTVSYDEHYELIRMAVETTAGRGVVMAGTGSNSTSEAIEATVEARRIGATHALLVAPYYNKPSQEGLFRHFQAIAEAADLPLVLYSIPGRCGIEIAVETVARLARECPNIVAIKEAGGNVERVHMLKAALPGEFSILSGDDSLTLPFMASGARGVVSVASNLIPGEVSAMVAAMLDGRLAEARDLHYQWYPLFKGMLSLDVNPVPIKAAMAMAGRIPSPAVRLPLVGLSAEAATRLATMLRENCLA
jgi:4-hydroxy-tetrahydrodipicolinate synthase